MVRSPRRVPLSLLLALPLSLACTSEPYGRAPAPSGDAKGPAGVANNGGRPITNVDDGKPLAKILPDAPLPILKMIGQPPPVAESFLGRPVSKGGTRKSCVRFVPERTWFRCEFVWQRYADTTGNFRVVGVTYEDGKAAGLNFESFTGEGPFDPRVALRKVGIETPGEPKIEHPQPNVTVWNWFNSQARLLIHGRQYRLRVSTVDNMWEKGKVELMLNDLLSADEKSRLIDAPPSDAGQPEGAPGDAKP